MCLSFVLQVWRHFECFLGIRYKLLFCCFTELYAGQPVLTAQHSGPECFALINGFEATWQSIRRFFAICFWSKIYVFLHVSRHDPLGCWVHSAQEGQQQVADCKLP